MSLGSTPVYSHTPLPVPPRAPIEWASSTYMYALFFLHILQGTGCIEFVKYQMYPSQSSYLLLLYLFIYPTLTPRMIDHLTLLSPSNYICCPPYCRFLRPSRQSSSMVCDVLAVHCKWPHAIFPPSAVVHYV